MSDIGVGDLVVCVDASGQRRISEGRVYRVVGMNVVPPGYRDAGTRGLRLEGIRANQRDGCYNIWRFRKLDDGDTQRLIEKLGVDMDAKEQTNALILGMVYPMRLVCRCRYYDWSDGMSDFTPEMDEAFGELIKVCERNIYPQPDKPESDWAKLLRAQAALAKARGEA